MLYDGEAEEGLLVGGSAEAGLLFLVASLCLRSWCGCGCGGSSGGGSEEEEEDDEALGVDRRCTAEG